MTNFLQAAKRLQTLKLTIEQEIKARIGDDVFEKLIDNRRNQNLHKMIDLHFFTKIEALDVFKNWIDIIKENIGFRARLTVITGK